MADNVLKRQMFENYLKQQQQQSGDHTNSAPSVVSDVGNETALVLHNDGPEKIGIDEFRSYVKKWCEIDNFIKRAREAIKEKKKAQDKLTEVITKFMCRYNIEDINTKEGRIRCKTQVVKAPVSQKVVKQRITDYFKDNDNQCSDILHKIYEER